MKILLMMKMPMEGILEMNREELINKVRSLILSPNPENQELGWMMDKSQTSGAVRKALEAENRVLLDASGMDIEELLEADEIYVFENGLDGDLVVNLPNLKYLNCHDNALESLDVSGCTKLKWLYCYDNALTSLDVSGCTKLEYLSCYNNELESLNVSGCANLELLFCENNALTSLDVSGCTKLVELYCNDNNITSLDVSGCTKLVELYCKSKHKNADGGHIGDE